MFLESRKCELQKFLGRIPTDSEWADNLGVPLPRLYARSVAESGGVRNLFNLSKLFIRVKRQVLDQYESDVLTG